jgi:hypothetical protein
MVQVVLLILKPAGSVGVTVQLVIAPPELLKVMNSRLNRFTEVDISSANNDNDGYYNASNYPNSNAFAALKTDGSITAWGDSNKGGSDAPSGNGYTKIYSTIAAFAALKIDGSTVLRAAKALELG